MQFWDHWSVIGNENSRFFGRRFESVQSENLDSCAARPEVQYCTIELLALEGLFMGTICMISEARCDSMLSRKLQIACCVSTLQLLKNVRMINSWLCSTSLYTGLITITNIIMSLGTVLVVVVAEVDLRALFFLFLADSPAAYTRSAT